MERHSIPTAKYQTFGDLERSTTYVREHGAPIVIKLTVGRRQGRDRCHG